MKRRLIDVAGLAAYLDTTPRHIYRMVEERRIPAVKLGDSKNSPLRFDLNVVDAWLDEHTQAAS